MDTDRPDSAPEEAIARDSARPEYRDALPICPRCLAPLPAGATRCPECGADATANSAPKDSGASGRRPFSQQLLRWAVLLVAGIAAILVGLIFLILLVPVLLMVFMLYILRRLAMVRDDER